MLSCLMFKFLMSFLIPNVCFYLQLCLNAAVKPFLFVNYNILWAEPKKNYMHI